MKLLSLYFNFYLCLNDYELSIAFKIKKEIEKRVQEGKGGFYLLEFEKTAYYEVSYIEECIKVAKFNVLDCIGDINDRKRILPVSFVMMEENIRNVVKFVKNNLEGNEERVVIILKEFNPSLNISEYDFTLLFRREFSEPIRNSEGKILSVETPFDLRYEGVIRMYPYTQFKNNKFVFRYNIGRGKFHSCFYYLQFKFEDEFVSDLVKSISHDVTISNLCNYVNRSKEYENKVMDSSVIFNDVYRMFPAGVDFSSPALTGPESLKKIDFLLKLEESQLVLNIQKHPTTTVTVKKLVNFIQNATSFKFRGLCVLLCHILENEKLFLKILRKSMGDSFPLYKVLFVCSFRELMCFLDLCTLRKTFYCPDKVELQDMYKILKQATFKRSIRELKPFLSLFYISCCDYLKKDLTVVVNQMSKDYENERVLKSICSEKEAKDLMFKALLFLSLPSKNRENAFFNGIKEYAATYNINKDQYDDLISKYYVLSSSGYDCRISELFSKIRQGKREFDVLN